MLWSPWAWSGRKQSLNRTALLSQFCPAAEGQTGDPGLKKRLNAAGKACPKTAQELALLFSEGKGIDRICCSPTKGLLSSVKHW